MHPPPPDDAQCSGPGLRRPPGRVGTGSGRGPVRARQWRRRRQPGPGGGPGLRPAPGHDLRRRPGPLPGDDGRGQSRPPSTSACSACMLTTPMGCGRSRSPPTSSRSGRWPTPRPAEASASKDMAGNGPVGAGREAGLGPARARGEAAFTSAALALGELLASGEGRSAERRRAGRRGGAAGGGRGALRTTSTSPAGWSRCGGCGGSRAADGARRRGARAPAARSASTRSSWPASRCRPDTPLELAAAFGAANQVIAPFGLRLEPPQVTKSTGDREVRVTPLKLVLGDGTAARPLLGPLMEALQPGREALLEAMKGFGQRRVQPRERRRVAPSRSSTSSPPPCRAPAGSTWSSAACWPPPRASTTATRSG